MMRVKGFITPQHIAVTKVTCTAGGLTTWVELLSRADGSGRTSVITGNTDEMLQWAKHLVQYIQTAQGGVKK